MKIVGLILKPCEKTKEDDEEKLKRDHHWNVERRSPKLASKTTHFYLKGLMLLMNMRKVWFHFSLNVWCWWLVSDICSTVPQIYELVIIVLVCEVKVCNATFSRPCKIAFYSNSHMQVAADIVLKLIETPASSLLLPHSTQEWLGVVRRLTPLPLSHQVTCPSHTPHPTMQALPCFAPWSPMSLTGK